MFDQVHHVAYVVDDMDKAIDFFSKKFDLELERRWVTESAGTEFATFLVGDFVFEFLSPASPTSRHHQTLKDRGGPSLDHVAYGVHDLDGVVKTLEDRGINLLTDGPQIAPTGWRVANIDPKSTMGIRVQLVDLDHKG
ncbi:MAG: VOC family protein [Chloroflexi bacterium]|nr:VOC family protein [Chloroflexota bacterium]MCL5025809.1 VOC family protein [Chloroflexota bacterium]